MVWAHCRTRPQSSLNSFSQLRVGIAVDSFQEIALIQFQDASHISASPCRIRIAFFSPGLYGHQVNVPGESVSSV